MATYHEDGNRDFRRYIESGVPMTGIMGANLLYMSQMGKMGGVNQGLASALAKDAMTKDPRLTINNVDVNKAFSKMGFKAPFDLSAFGAAYHPRSNTVNAPKGNYGFLAHELGHAEQYKNPLYRKTLAPFSAAGRIAAQFGVLAPILTDNEQEARRNSIVAGAMQVPTLIEEIDASRRGSNILKKQMASKPAVLGTKTSKLGQALMRLRPFVGLPTYAMAAMTPYLIYQYMKNRGLYEGEY